MTDSTTFLNFCVSTTRQFNSVFGDLKSISDRIGADTALSAATAAAAAKVGRTDLAAADFDNLKACVDLVATLLNAVNGGNVPVAVNTGGTVKLGFYKIV